MKKEPIHVLLIDDSPDDLQIEQTLLSRTKGIDGVSTAANSHEAHKILYDKNRKDKITHVISDSLEGEWKRVVKDAKGLPVFVISAALPDQAKLLSQEVLDVGAKFFRKSERDLYPRLGRFITGEEESSRSVETEPR